MGLLLEAAGAGAEPEFLGMAGAGSRAGGFCLRVLGTCAVFYILFLCRMLGAGDIKLMGLCVGFLGCWDGLLVILLGLGLAAVRAAALLIQRGILWERLERLARFAVVVGRNGRPGEYPGRREADSLMRLGPYLFAGYLLALALGV